MESNQKSTSYWIPIVMAACLAMGLFLGNVLAPKTVADFSSNDAQSQKIQDIIDVLGYNPLPVSAVVNLERNKKESIRVEPIIKSIRKIKSFYEKQGFPFA